MTLRYDENRKPVGLDWSVCTDGQERPDVWRNPIAVAKALKACEDQTNHAVRRPDRPAPQRLPQAVELQVVKLYRDEKLSALEIGRIVGIQPGTVFKVLRRREVPTRSSSEAMKLSRAKRRVQP